MSTKKLKIAWFSELPFNGKVSREFNNMRTEYAWFVAQDAEHYNIRSLGNLPDQSYDVGIIIVPKNISPFLSFPISDHLKRVCKIHGFMQEGPSWYFQDLPLAESFFFFNLMKECDFVLCHNYGDREYYRGLLDKPTFINPTLMIEDSIKDLPEVERSGVIVGGNMVRWYGGFNSYMVALRIQEEIYFPSMGRMDPNEKYVEGINHIDYKDWVDWMNQLNKFKYAVHLNPNTIGGTFNLNCAFLGIPCIGNLHSDTQYKCFPDLSVEPDNLKRSSDLLYKLKNDEEFYKECSEKSKILYRVHFSEPEYLVNWSLIENELTNLYKFK